MVASAYPLADASAPLSPRFEMLSLNRGHRRIRSKSYAKSSRIYRLPKVISEKGGPSPVNTPFSSLISERTFGSCYSLTPGFAIKR